MDKRTLLIIGGVVGAFFLCICVGVAGFFGWQAYQATTAVATEVVSQIEELEVPTVDISIFTPEPTEATEPTEAPELPEPTAVAPVQTTSGLSEEDARYAAGYFVLYLSQEDYASAVSMTIADMRNNPDTEGQLRDLVVNQGFKPVIWEWMDTQVDGGLADLTGVINFDDGRRGKVEVQVSDENGSWMVNYVNFTTDGEAVDPGALSTWDEQRTEEELTFATATADYFIKDWAAGDWENAFLLAAQPLKDDVVDAAGLQNILGTMGVTPDTWTWDSNDFIEVDSQVQPVIELVGTINFAEGVSGPITIQLMWEGGFWSVMYFDVKTN